MAVLMEKERTIPLIGDFDLCVVGGSATGVFAAVRAARLGAKVAIVEQTNCFGGTTVNSLVANWHSLHDFRYRQKIIGGLIQETLDRLERRGAMVFKPQMRNAYFLNPEELKIELDDLVLSHGITPFLNTFFCASHTEGDRIRAIIVEDKSGRRAIGARYFVDASGDGDLAARSGADFELPAALQPGTYVYQTTGLPPREEFDLTAMIAEHGPEFGLAPDFGWCYPNPVAPSVSEHFDTHTFGVVSCDADNLTRSEMRGRAQARAVMDLIKSYAPQANRVALVDLAARVGIRESRHIRCLHRVTGEELLAGTRFPDAIANGTYPPDIHDPETGATRLRFLDGSEVSTKQGGAKTEGRWKPIQADHPLFYQVPFRSLVCRGFANLAVAGRCLDADPWAFGGLRVQVNCMQLGEAAGTAAALASRTGSSLADVDPALLRKTLAEGGSIVL